MSTERITETEGGWLVLLHHLPADPAYLRVKVLRRLKGLGAVALKSSAYVLPHDPETLEDFQWLRREILEGGGEATIAVCRFVHGVTDDDLREQFRSAADAEYAELAAAIARLGDAGSPSHGDIERFERRLEKIRSRDHFVAPGRMAAEAALRGLRDSIHAPLRKETLTMHEAPHGAPHGATWVTREHVKVDRMASSWLVRRFIDPQARFKFVAPEGYRPESGELRFDMFEGEFTHEGADCTFETLMRRFGLGDPGLRPIAEIVHEIDCKDDRYARPETPGIAALVEGIAARHESDDRRLDAACDLFDSLFERLRAGD